MKYSGYIFQKNIQQQPLEISVVENTKYSKTNFTTNIQLKVKSENIFKRNFRTNLHVFSFQFQGSLALYYLHEERHNQFPSEAWCSQVTLELSQNLVGGKRQGNCSHPMCLKETKDSKDLYVWHCRKVHNIVKDTRTYAVKDIKLSV